MNKESTMTIRIEEDLRTSFIEAANSDHRPAAQVMRDLMREYVRRMRQKAVDAISKPAVGEYTYEKGVKYEAAREVLNARIVGISARIEQEEGAPDPDIALIDQLEREMADVGVEIDGLDATDDDAMDQVLSMGR